MWKCVSSGTPIRSRVWRTNIRTPWGERTPNVSTSPTASTCPSVATFWRRSRYSTSPARVASIGKNETVSPSSCARLVASTDASIARWTGHRYAFSTR